MSIFAPSPFAWGAALVSKAPRTQFVSVKGPVPVTSW